VISKTKNGVGLFFKQGIKKFKTQGSIFPSSKFLGNKILKHVKMFDGICIVELGAGTGAFTQQIIKRLPENSKLLVFEIDPQLVIFLKNIIDDDRVLIIEGDARKMKSFLPKSINNIDYIISGLPLGNFSKSDRELILNSIKDSLGKRGVFLQFQYLMASYLHIKKVFNVKIVGYEYRNLPPAFIYKCVNK
jgi:phospholipid N-methyltransferase